MGCTVSCPNQLTMLMLKRNSQSENEAKVILEQKLYLARESPEPVFDLSDCQLRHVPSGIYSLCKVFRKDSLYLQNNKLSTLEDGGHLEDLHLLKVLNISGNKFSFLHNLKHLINLTELYLQDNQFKSLPDCIQHLKSLRIFNISKNKLQTLTPCIGRLPNLRILIISDNPDLKKLCRELCQANNLTTLELDVDNYIYPPQDVVIKGTIEIMMFLCNDMNIPYVPPSPLESPVGSQSQSATALQSPFDRKPLYSWEDHEAAMVEQERRLHEASIQQREKFLTEMLKEQSELDAEIAKVQEIKDAERQQLIKSIQHEEKQVQLLLSNFMRSNNMNPEVIQQQLEYEQAEHDRLLEISRQNYINVRKFDILKAMEDLIDEDRAIQSSKQKYDAYLSNVKDNMMLQELECSEKLEELLKAKDETREFLVQQLLEDQDIQKAIVASLLERVDAKSWSLNQEIAIVTSNLAKLSVIEQEKQKLHLSYNYHQLLDQRVQLLTLLDDLLEQQNKRRVQLVETLKEMEKEQTENMTDFWLKNYQKLIESAPRLLLDTGKNLDPQFANFLLQEGVIHCLPFLVKFIFSDESLTSITSEKLKESGVTLPLDRESILRAIENYLAMKSKLPVREENLMEPSAPPEVAVEEQNQGAVVDINTDESSTMASECVICMDAKCEVVWVPCGHMCCCYSCSEKGLLNCPMCRVDIEKRIRVMIP